MLVSAMLIALVGGLSAAPAEAQRNERVMVVYGDDPCPKGEDPEEIVVCARQPEGERYRIPERFRKQEIGPENANESWAVRAEALEYVGRTGINSCSPVGGGGWTGCYAEMLRLAREERRQLAREREGR